MRKTAIIMAVALLAAVLTGCGGKGGDNLSKVKVSEEEFKKFTEDIDAVLSGVGKKAIPASAPDTAAYVVSVPDADDDAQAIAMLKGFYNLYVAKDLSVFSNEDILKNKYITKKFFKKLEVETEKDEMYPDSDPILSAQDRDTSWMKSLEVKPVAERSGAYEVCYDDRQICVTVFIVKINEKYLIDSTDVLY
jgi:hypothetical protein